MTGREPISCSSKHSSAAGFEITGSSSSVDPGKDEDGKDTVAANCDCGSSRAFLLEEFTA